MGTIAHAIVDLDFDMVYERILGPYDAFSDWLWSVYDAKRNESGWKRTRRIPDIGRMWWRLADAHDIVLSDIHRHPCGKFSREAGLQVQTWNKKKASSSSSSSGGPWGTACSGGPVGTASKGSASLGTASLATPPKGGSFRSTSKGEPSRWVRGAVSGSMAGSSHAVDVMMHSIKGHFVRTHTDMARGRGTLVHVMVSWSHFLCMDIRVRACGMHRSRMFLEGQREEPDVGCVDAVQHSRVGDGRYREDDDPGNKERITCVQRRGERGHWAIGDKATMVSKKNRRRVRRSEGRGRVRLLCDRASFVTLSG